MKRFLKASLLCGVAMAVSVPAHGQSVERPSAPSTPGAMAPDQAGNQAIPDIIVTAQKKSENLQRVPAAVSVLGGASLAASGVTTLDQIGNLVPGISIVPVRTQAFVFIRGVGQTLTSPNADAAVATNLNGAYLPAEIAGTAFFDIDHIELVPGPQGTLYGRNSAGGVVNVTTRMPKSRFGIDGFVEIGNYNRRQIVLGVDLPITDTLHSRTAGTIVQHDGYYSNGEDDQRSRAVRETLVWRPSGSTTVTGVAAYTHDGGIGSLFQNIPGLECGDRCATFDPRALGYYNRVDTVQSSLTIEQRLNSTLSLTYIGGYNHLNIRVKNSIWTGPPLAPLLFNERIGIQSHELRLNGDFGSLQGILGAYYFDQDTFYRNDVRPSATQHRIAPFDAGSHGEAVFGQVTYSVLPSVRLTGGLRYSSTVKDIDGVNNAYNGADVLLTSRPYQGRSTLGRVDWKVGAEIDLTPTSLLYGNVSTGFTPGGFSTGQLIVGQTAAAPFKPVTLRAYVLGIKNKLAQGRLTVNVEGFYYDYKNYQVSARNIATGENNVYNADKATVYGAQLDVRFAPTRNDNLSLGATLLHAVADRLVTPAGNFDGFTLPYSPSKTINASYQHVFDLSNDGQIRAGANFKYTSGRWSIYTHAAGFYINANTHTDLTLGYYAPLEHWYIQGFVRNLEDNLVKTSCGNVTPGPAGCFFESPRTYGATLGFKF